MNDGCRHCIAALATLVAGVTVAFAPSEETPSRADELGRAVYTNCAACHGAAGEGGFAPPLVANERLQQTDYLITHILNGSPVMPAFKDQLSYDEIAAVVNHVRNSWGNRFGTISAADVAEITRRLAETRS